jgi:hypothetical protein
MQDTPSEMDKITQISYTALEKYIVRGSYFSLNFGSITIVSPVR